MRESGGYEGPRSRPRVGSERMTLADVEVAAPPTSAPPLLAGLRRVAERAQRRLGPEWARAWRWGAVVWVTSRLGMIVVTYVAVLLGSLLVPDTDSNAASARHGLVSLGAFLRAWQRLDANWYVGIATQGYTSPYPTAFFPLYPLLIRGLHQALPWVSPLTCALIVSNAALLAALVLLVRLTERELGVQASRTSAVLLMAYPAAFCLSAGYTEATFLAFVLGAFLALRTGRWTVAGALAAAATLTRPTGGLLLLPFAWEYLRQSPVSWGELRASGLRWKHWAGQGGAVRILLGRLVAIAGIPLAVGAYSVYLWVRFGNPIIFLKAERMYWNHQHTSPVGGLALALTALARHPFTSYADARGLLDLVPILLCSGVLLLGARRLPVAYTLFGLGIMALTLMAPIPGDRPLMSGVRYVLSAFPAFMLLGMWGQRWPALRICLTQLWLPLQGILLLLYLYGQGAI